MKHLILILFTASALSAATVGEPAPDFTLKSSDGKTVSLSDYKGKWVVLEWINFGCPYVKKHYRSKNMQSLQKKYRAEGVIWLAINSSAEGKQGNYNRKVLNKKLKQNDFSATAYLLDTSGRTGRNYNAKTTPHMYIISPEGKLMYNGAIDSKPTTRTKDIKSATNYVDKNLKAALAGADLPYKATRAYGCSVKY